MFYNLSVILLICFLARNGVVSADSDSEDAELKPSDKHSLITLSDDTYSEVFSREDKTFLLVFAEADDVSQGKNDVKNVKNILDVVPVKWKGKVHFVWVDWTNPKLQRVRDWFGIFPDIHTPPMIRGLKSKNLKRYKPTEDGDVSAERIADFLQQLQQRKLQPFLPSEPLPDSWDSQPVKVLVGDNFDSVVMDKTRHVLVDLYAPWCGHCKRLEPILEQLGDKYKDSSDIIIAKMDSTRNELSHTRPRSFPSIRMWKKNTNDVVEYNGERTLQGITRFIETNGEYGRGPMEDEELGDEEIEYEEDLEDEEVETDDQSQRHEEL